MCINHWTELWSPPLGLIVTSKDQGHLVGPGAQGHLTTLLSCHPHSSVTVYQTAPPTFLALTLVIMLSVGQRWSLPSTVLHSACTLSPVRIFVLGPSAHPGPAFILVSLSLKRIKKRKLGSILFSDGSAFAMSYCCSCCCCCQSLISDTQNAMFYINHPNVMRFLQSKTTRL